MGRHVCEILGRAVRLFGERPACLAGGVERTWAEVGDRVARAAGGLGELGVGAGDRVAVLSLNSPEFLELYYAVPWAGARVVPLSYRMAPPELAYCIRDSGAEIIFADDAHLGLAREVEAMLPELRWVIRLDGGAAGGRAAGGRAGGRAVGGGAAGGNYAELVCASDPLPLVAVGEDEVAGIFYTGGTTGHPKGVALTHRNLCDSAMQVIIAMGYEGDDVYLHAAPMFHLADGVAVFSLTWLGATHAFLPQFRPGAVVEAVERYGVTTFTMVATMYTMLVHDPAFDRSRLGSLRRVFYSGSPMPPEVLSEVMREFGCEIGQGYGMTETASRLTCLMPADHLAGVASGAGEAERARLASAGREIVGVEVRILAEDGRDCAVGEVGEITARGPNVMAGYWNDPASTAEVLRDGWMHTGDLGYKDGGGYVFIVDRLKDMIISGGENVYSVEVEQALQSHRAVREAAVIGLPDETWGERVHAVVALRDGIRAGADELGEHCRGLIAGYKVPRSWEFVDQLPRSAAGKVLKRALRDRGRALGDDVVGR